MVRSGSESPLPEVAVLVGTDHHPFDRLIDWCLCLAAEGQHAWFIQYGTSHWPTQVPAGVRGSAMLESRTLNQVIARCSAVITHGGPGLMMDASWGGHTPLVVARNPDLGEHVDHHQERFVNRIASSGRIHAIGSLEELRGAVAGALATPHPTGSPVPMDAPGEAMHHGNRETTARFTELVAATMAHRVRAGGV